MPPDNRLWTHDETATYLHVSPWTLQYLCSEGRGPRSVKIGKHRRYDPRDIKAWLRQDEASATKGTP